MTTDWLIGVAFLVVTEILYFSLCHNFEDKKETIIADLLVVKFMSMFLVAINVWLGLKFYGGKKHGKK